MKNNHSEKNPLNVSAYSSGVNILENDPLEEIFELNMGDFLTEHLINSDLANKIGKRHDKNVNLKNQLKELISIYSIDNTLTLLGFNSSEEQIIYNSIAHTICKMLNLEFCNIYTQKKNEELKLSGTSLDTQIEISKEVLKSQEREEIIELYNNENQILIFPMRNNFECIGAIEVARKNKRPLEFEYQELIKITAGLFVTSLGLQKLIDEVQKVLGDDVIVTTSELQNLRAQLTILIGDLGDQQQAFVEKIAQAVDLKGKGGSSHSRHVAELSKELCMKLGLGDKTTDLIYWAGMLQNIGQITIDDKLFNKSEKLTKEEWEKLQDHPNAGVTLLMNINFMSEVIPYIHYQKERWNGEGKPEGLEGNSIPFGSRIISLADAYCFSVGTFFHKRAISISK